MPETLRRALLLGAALSVATLPRYVLYAHDRQPSTIALLFLLQIPLFALVADAPLSWGTRAGMAGLWPERSVALRPAAAGAGLGIALGILYLATDDPVRAALERGGDPDRYALAYPASGAEILASLPFTAGFEVLFFYGFVMAVLARVTDRLPVAILGAVLVRSAVSIAALAQLHIVGPALPQVAIGIVTSACLAMLYARGGFLAPCVLAAVLRLRLVFAT